MCDLLGCISRCIKVNVYDCGCLVLMTWEDTEHACSGDENTARDATIIYLSILLTAVSSSQLTARNPRLPNTHTHPCNPAIVMAEQTAGTRKRKQAATALSKDSRADEVHA